MQPGFAIIHANQLETLAALAIQHCQNHPLAPLEEEVVLVQSNGMADWLKLKQAETTGISAAMRFPMPASFLWEMYQRVLSPERINAPSPFAKDSLQWRLLRLLPDLLERAEFVRPREFLASDSSQTRLFDLSRKLADLFDQYPLYRADWIKKWEAGQLVGLGQDEAWQAALWRALIDDLPAADRQRSRAHLHQLFLNRLREETSPVGLPRRILLFGINSLPKQLLDALYALSRHSQLLLMVLNPCQAYWGDRGLPQLDGFSFTNPLLDAWGTHGRDFLKLLTETETTENVWGSANTLDPFADAADFTRADSLICALQQSILDNTLPEPTALPMNPGLAFLPAFSRQREVEVLHDRLLTLFADDTELQYSDVIVMTPDIERYAPHIEATFLRYEREDARHLAFSISDRRDENASPLFQAVEYLLKLPSNRLTSSEVLSLLQLTSLQQAFGMDAADLPQLTAWIEDSHIRWGLSAQHRQQNFDLPASNFNTWRAGLDQLLAGYCVGAADLFESFTPLDEVSANQGALLGKLCAFIEQLDSFQREFSKPKSVSDWVATFTQLLARFFHVTDDTESLLLARLHQALAAWQGHCALANFNAPLPLAQARLAWLDQLQQAGMTQQLAFNGITFCTLMPMRALPFKHVFLLGMNDGDYPREQQAPDFDLMQDNYRAGDRNRRDSDQYLLLEALMSVRDSLTISWVGHDISRNTVLPPSVLVEQLRDLVDRCWHTSTASKASAALTQQLPLAAFSRRYFEAGAQNPRTHDQEWRALHIPANASTPETDEQLPICSEVFLSQLAGLLKTPVNTFYVDRLHTRPEQIDELEEDDEPFALNNLQQWQLRNDLLQALLQQEAPALKRWQQNGALPAGHFSQKIINAGLDEATRIHTRWRDRLTDTQSLPSRQVHVEVALLNQPVSLRGTLTDLYSSDAQLLLVQTSAGKIKENKRWRFDKLASVWVNHLATCATGLSVRSLLIALDGHIEVEPLAANAAHTELQRLLLVYHLARERPLFLDPRTGELAESPTEKLPAAEKKLLSFLRQHWPENADDEPNNALFAELLYRPLQNAIEEQP